MVNGEVIGFYIRIFRSPIKVLSKGCKLTFAESECTETRLLPLEMLCSERTVQQNKNCILIQSNTCLQPII